MQTRIDPQGFRLRTVLNKGIPKNAFAESVVYLWTNQPKFPRGVGCWKINFVIVDFDASIEARLETDGNFGADRKLVQKIVAFGRGEQSTVDGAYGLEATRMILAAMKSIDEGGVTVDLENF